MNYKMEAMDFEKLWQMLYYFIVFLTYYGLPHMAKTAMKCYNSYYNFKLMCQVNILNKERPMRTLQASPLVSCSGWFIML